MSEANTFKQNKINVQIRNHYIRPKCNVAMQQLPPFHLTANPDLNVYDTQNKHHTDSKYKYFPKQQMFLC